MRQWLCVFLPHKWIHVTDIVAGKNQFDQPIILGLWQCRRCKELSKGRCSHAPLTEELAEEKIGESPLKKNKKRVP